MRIEEKVEEMTDVQIKEDLKERNETLYEEELHLDDDIETKGELVDLREAKEEKEKLREDKKKDHHHHIL
ncbi:MAG: hypothetical protein ACRC6T_08400 [Sarcina sp.]